MTSLRAGRPGGSRPMLAVAVAWAVVACAACSRPPSAPQAASTARLATATLVISTGSGPVRLRVRVADTEKARRRGLMGVRRLDPDAGMAFLFDGPVRSRFWMKDTPIPLSIAFWDPSGRVVATLEMPPCRADPCPLYGPRVPFVGAVEANRGFLARHGVRPGDRVRLVPGRSPGSGS